MGEGEAGSGPCFCPTGRREATKGLGGSNPHVSKTTRGICTNPKRCLPLEKGYPCILGWPGEAIHSTQNIVKPLGGRGSAPNPGRWGNSQRWPRPPSWWGGGWLSSPQNHTPLSALRALAIGPQSQTVRPFQ